MRLHYLCRDGHRITAPAGAIDSCPLAWCNKPLEEVGENWGRLRKKDNGERLATAKARMHKAVGR